MHGTLPSRPAWFPDWTNEIAAIIGGGPSVNAEAVAKLKGRCRVIVVNNSFRIAPWADVLYAADWKWWSAYPDALKFAGLKVAPPDERAAESWRLTHIGLFDKGDMRLSMELGKLSRGGFGNSGAQAVNLALQFGARRILLLGLDFTGNHWHGDHPQVLINPSQQTMQKWREAFDAWADEFKRIGCEVVNVSQQSTLTAYPKADIESALARWQ